MGEQVTPQVLISRLASSEEGWRVDAELRLVELGTPAVVPLIGALGHANPAVRLHAVRALAKVKDARALAGVVRALGDAENNGAVAIAAERALGDWGAAAAGEVLRAAQTGPVEIRPRALRTLGRIGGPAEAAALKTLLTDATAAVRIQAAAALGQISGESAIEAIAPLLNDSDKWVRYEVAETLVRLSCVRGEQALREAAEDPEEAGSHVQFWAEDLLDEISELRRLGRAVE
ncbi:MAG: HEAT repeat domain-containing protein [Myxococcaceae bacterium]